LTAFSQWRPHPWHGLEVGPALPDLVNAFIEITPFDLMKYEVDKVSGYLHIDRPQRSSAQHPTLYGFIPRTYCAERVRKLAPGSKKGDGDPLDICVISERPIARSELIVPARVVGGLQLIDRGEADDKIVAVLEGDFVWGETRDITYIGLGKSTLDAVAGEVAAYQQRVVKGDQFPDRGMYYRSDQFNFAKIGVPAFYFSGGTDFIGRPEGWGTEQINLYTDQNYHQPSDELTPEWNFAGVSSSLG